MSVNAPTSVSVDPFQLDRLAEELVARESFHPGDNKESPTHDLPPYVPLSHDNPYLTATTFNVEEFLLSRSYTSLPDLRAELREYLSELKEELVKLINHDYEAFISLSTDLKDEGVRLIRLKSPLSDVRSQILRSRDELQIIQDAIQGKLTQRAKLREEKTLLHLLLKLSESVTRLESLLLITSPEQVDVKSPEVDDLRMPSYLRNVEDSADDKSRGNRAKHLGRVAAEYTQLLYHTSKARKENCVFVDEIQWRIDRIHSTLSSDLDHLFANTLVALTGEGKVLEVEKAKLNADLTECLRTYDVLGLWRDAEDVLQREVFRGFIKKSIYPGALAAPHSPILPHTPFPVAKTSSFLSASSLPPRTPYTPFTAHLSSKQNSIHDLGSGGSSPYAHLLEDIDDPLARLYKQILRFIERDLSRIMDIAEKVSVKSTRFPSAKEGHVSRSPVDDVFIEGKGFEIMANVIWGEIGHAIMNELGGVVFSVGRPDDFRRHYEISQAFIRSLEFLAPSIHSVEVMRAHPVYSAFEQRWQLSVYFQMRWKEIVGKLEDVLAVTRIDPTYARDKNAFVTPQANAVWVAITGCWSAEVFIPELCHRFWRLTLQILSRYRRWLDHCTSVESAPKSSTGSGPEKNFASPHTRSSTPIPTSEPPSAENTAADDAILQQYAAAIVDIKAMRTNVLTIWLEEISMMLPEMSDTGGSGGDGVTSQEALQNALSELISLTVPMSNQIVTILTKRCCDTLLPVRSLPSQFRAMSNKRMPTEPSYFVPSILRPIKLFFGVGVGEGPGSLLSDDHLKSYSTEVFDGVSHRYVYYLSSMKKTEESLRRLKKGKKTPFSLFGTSVSKDEEGKDEERIRTQMILDVQAFGKDAESLDVTLNNSEAYKALEDMVHTIDVPEP